MKLKLEGPVTVEIDKNDLTEDLINVTWSDIFGWSGDKAPQVVDKLLAKYEGSEFLVDTLLTLLDELISRDLIKLDVSFCPNSWPVCDAKALTAEHEDTHINETTEATPIPVEDLRLMVKSKHFEVWLRPARQSAYFEDVK